MKTLPSTSSSPGSWDDTGLQTTSCNQLINDGADIIAPFQDTIKTIVEICAANGIHCFGCNSDAYELDPETWLSAASTPPEGWLEYIKKAIDGEYETVSVIGSMVWDSKTLVLTAILFPKKSAVRLTR